jgi:hypothetical protein
MIETKKHRNKLKLLILNILLKFKKATSIEDEIPLNYSSLSPIDNADEKGYYSKTLMWALENRKKEDIKNIALTGPYGFRKKQYIKNCSEKL